MKLTGDLLKLQKKKINMEFLCDGIIFFIKCRKPAHSSSVWNILIQRQVHFAFNFLRVFEASVWIVIFLISSKEREGPKYLRFENYARQNIRVDIIVDCKNFGPRKFRSVKFLRCKIFGCKNSWGEFFLGEIS